MSGEDKDPAEEPKDPPEEPQDPAEEPSSSDETIVQSEDVKGASKTLSEPGESDQHPDAPKIPGYILTAPVGRGAFAEVWKAWQVRTRKEVAVKVFTQRSGVNWLFLQREIERLIRLDKHPHIVSLLDADLTGEPSYYVMDLLEGGSLEKYVGKGGGAPVKEAARWMDEICDALSYVHSKGLIHCDLKPANVLLDEGGHVRVADFGQSRIVTESSGALGTLFYMAPEQAVTLEDSADLHPDVRWDVYGLGATMWAVLTGEVPHGGIRGTLEKAGSLKERLRTYRESLRKDPLKSSREVTGERVDPDLSAVVAKCAAAGPEGRYKAIAETQSDLAARREMRPVTPLARDRVYRLKRFVQRNAPLVALGGIAALVLTGAFFQILSQKNELVRKQAALKKEREALKKERDTALNRLAMYFAERGRAAVDKGDRLSAAAYYAHSNSLYPSPLARTNVLSSIRHLGVPDKVLGKESGALSFSRDGGTVWVDGRESGRLWDVRTGEPLGAGVRYEHYVRKAFLGPDGRTVFVKGEGKNRVKARLLDARTGKSVLKVASKDGMAISVGFGPDGRAVAAVKRDKILRLRDARTGKARGKDLPHEREVADAYFSPDGNRLLTLTVEELPPKKSSTGSTFPQWSSKARFWDARTCEAVGKAVTLEHKIRGVVFSPDGLTVLLRSFSRAWILDAAAGKQLGPAIPSGTRMVFSPDGKVMAIVPNDYFGRKKLWGSAKGDFCLWDVRAGKLIGKPLLHGSKVRAVAFSPDGGTLSTGGKDGRVRLWNVAAQEAAGAVLELGGPVAAFSPDGRAVLTREGKNVRLWNARTGRPIGKRILLSASYNSGVVFSPDGKSVLTRVPGAGIGVWNVGGERATGRLVRHEPPADEPPARGRPGEYDLPRLAPYVPVAFSRDGGSVLTLGGREGRWARLWDLRAGKPVGRPMRHEGEPAGRRSRGRRGEPSVRLAPDGKTVLTTAVIEAVELLAARTGKARGRPLALEGWVTGVAFNRDGSKVLIGDDGGTARLRDAATGEPIGKPLRHGGSITAVALSPDGKTALTTTGGETSSPGPAGPSTARLWNVRTGEPIGNPIEHEGRTSGAAFSPDGKTLVTGSSKYVVRLWDARTGRPISRGMSHIASRTPTEIDADLEVGFAPDGKTVFSSGFGGARLWNGRTGAPIGKVQRVKVRPEELRMPVVAFSPDGGTVVMGGDAAARLLDARTGARSGSTMRLGSPVEAVAFSPDGKRVLTASSDTVRLWDARTGRPLGIVMRHTGPVWDAAFSPDGKSVLTAGYETIVSTGRFGSSEAHFKVTRLWDARTGAPAGKRIRHSEESGRRSRGDPFLEISPAANVVLRASRRDVVRVWDAAAGAPVGKLVFPKGTVRAVRLGPHGKRVLMAGEGHVARIWDVRAGKPVGRPLRQRNTVSGTPAPLAFSPDGETVLMAGRNPRVFDARTGKPAGKPFKPRYANAVVSAVFSPDGKFVLTANSPEAEIWEASSGERLGGPIPIKSRSYVLPKFVFSPDGRVVLSLDSNKARLWAVHTGAPIGKIMPHPKTVNAAAFRPGGRTVLTGGEDKAARFWDASTGEPVGEVIVTSGAVKAVGFSGDGKTALIGTDAGETHLVDATWLDGGASPERLLMRAQLASHRKVGPQGDIETLSAKEWRELYERYAKPDRTEPAVSP